MDKKILDALNNLSVALEEVANSLKDKSQNTSATATALTSSDLDKKIKSIDNGIKQIQADNKKIIKNQETLLSMSRRTQPSTQASPIDTSLDPKQKERLKSGLGSILMIAVGILAIGAAFKIIGKVNFLSVISLAIALPLVAIAFEKIAKMKDLSVGQIGKLILVTVGIAIAIALSSRILGMVQPVGILKLITSIFIAGIFAAVSYSIGTLMKNLKGVDPKQTYKLPIVMIAVSLAIALSSVLLQGVMPVGIFKLFTAVMIAAMFGVVSFGLGKLLEGLAKVKKSDMANIEMLPFIMVSITLAIVASSILLQAVMPVGIFKLFTAVLIAAVFVVISYSIDKIMKGVKGVSLKDVGIGALVLVAITAAIVGAAFLLQIMPVVKTNQLFSFVGVALALSASVLAVGFTMYALSKLGYKEILEGSLIMIAVAIAIVVTSFIISEGDYSNYPDYKWAIGVSLSLVAFGLGALALGTAITLTAGLGGVALAVGLASILVIAATVVLAAEIVSKGNYVKYPPVDWSTSIALSLGAFGMGSILLGSFILGTFGLGAAALATGNEAILMIADTIREASFRLKGGNWTGGPTKEWAEGVALAIGSFAPVYGVLAESAGFFSSGPSVEDMKNAIMTISQGIVDAANFFGGNVQAFDVSKVPSKKWAEGVGGAIGAFMPALEYISKNDGIFKSGQEALTQGIMSVSNSIVMSSLLLAGGRYDKTIPQDFMRSISDNIRTYVDLAKYLSDSDVSTFGMLGVVFGMKKLADGYERLAEGVSKLGNELNKIDTDKLMALKNLTGSIVMLSLMDSEQFEKMMDALEDKAKILVDVMNDVQEDTSKSNKAPLSTVRTGGSKVTPQKTLDDVYNIMSQMQRDTASIAKSSDKLSKYVDEIRGGDSINLGKKK